MTFIIAEVGVNHSGKLDAASKLVMAAKEAGADAVKFQLFSSQKLWGDDRIKHLELSLNCMEMLRELCRNIGIEFMCTPFGVEEVHALAPLVKRMKIASGCIAHLALLNTVSETGLPVILSTGMSDLFDVKAALRELDDDVSLLHCTSSYPCRLEDVNLRAMDELAVFGKPVGYSDHTSSITVPIAAVARGATIIEKHLTLDRNAVGPDHKASITPKEFKAMVLAIREVEAALGSGEKRVQPCEEKLREVWRGK